MAAQQDIENRIPITVALILATLMNALDTTIANVALPHIQGSVSASQDQAIWVLTSYIIATAVMTPLSGWLSEKIGRKRMLLLSIGGFTAASMLCGIATSLPEMVVFRLLQGIAGASLQPLSQTIMLDIYPARLMPRVISIWSAVVMLGPILGPTVGGWLTENLSWRWCFYINLPVGALAFFCFWVFMAHDEGGRQRPFDFLGFGALVMMVLGLQVMLDRGAQEDWFSSKEIWLEAVIALIGVYVFTIQTLSAKHPFFDRALAKDRNFASSTIFGMFVGALVFSTTALLPSFMQNLLGYSAMQSGMASMTRGVGSLITFICLPWLMLRVGVRNVLIAGVLCNFWSAWRMSHFDLSMTVDPIMLAGFIQGVGTGMMFAPLNTMAYVTLPPQHRVEGAIVASMARNMGSSAGISVVQTMIARDSAVAHARLADHLGVEGGLLRSVLPASMDPNTHAGLAALNAEVTRQGSMISYANIFSWMALGSILLLPLILSVKAPPRRMVEHEVHAD